MLWRRGIGLMALLVLLLGSGYAAYWYVVKTQLEIIVNDWFSGWAEAGYGAGYTPGGANGFPFLVRLNLADITLADPGGAWSWLGEKAAIEIRPWEPTSYRLELFGAHDVSLPLSGQRIDTEMQAGSAVGIARTDVDGRLRYLSIDFSDLQTYAPALGQSARADRLAMELNLPPTPPVRHDELFGETLLIADNLSLPSGYHGPLGADLNRLSMRLQLMGPIEKAETEMMLAKWRDAGGVLEVPWFRLDWGPLRLDGNGTIALDSFFRPEGAFAGRVTGVDETMRRFSEAGLINRTMANLVSAGLQLLAVQPEDGGPPYVSTPIQAQDGALYLGPFKLAEVPPIIPKKNLDRAAAAPVSPVTIDEIPEPATPPTVGGETQQ